MGKIIGKSALCFAGLVVACWLAYLLSDQILITHKSVLASMIYYTFCTFLIHSVIAIAYPYVLYLLFRGNKSCYLIIMFNGLLAVLQYYLLLLICDILNTCQFVDMLSASFVCMIPAGFSTLVFTLMFKSLQKR